MATPHLGAFYEKKLHRVGFWLMKLLDNVDSLCQLQLEDSSNIEGKLLKFYLYRNVSV